MNNNEPAEQYGDFEGSSSFSLSFTFRLPLRIKPPSLTLCRFEPGAHNSLDGSTFFAPSLPFTWSIHLISFYNGAGRRFFRHPPRPCQRGRGETSSCAGQTRTAQDCEYSFIFEEVIARCACEVLWNGPWPGELRKWDCLCANDSDQTCSSA